MDPVIVPPKAIDCIYEYPDVAPVCGQNIVVEPTIFVTPSNGGAACPGAQVVEEVCDCVYSCPAVVAPCGETIVRAPDIFVEPKGGGLPCPQCSYTGPACPTRTATPRPTATVTRTRTSTPTATRTPSPTGTSSPTPPATGTATPTVTITVTPTPSVTVTPTPSVTVTVSPTGTATPEQTETPDVTETPDETIPPEESSTPEATGTPEQTGTPQETETAQATGTPDDTETPTATPTCSYYVVSVELGNDDPNSTGSNSHVTNSGECSDVAAGEIAGIVDSFPGNGDFNQYMSENLSQWTYYYDTGCGKLEEAPEGRMCGDGSVTAWSSPLTLDLGPQRPWTVVKFPLNPNDPHSFVVWKASKNHPLVVYDPEGKGVIRDGSQLFGNWTFHGSKRAPHRPAGTQLWEDGYKALANLDQNGDGYLDTSAGANELRHLALWFDENQNGISESGEVRPLSSAGITRLRTTFDTKETNGDLVAQGGYERTNDNRVHVTGRSFDWFSGSYPNVDSALQSLVKSRLTDPSAPIKRPALRAVKHEPSGSSLAANMSGVWRWKLDEHPEQGGTLVIKDTGDDIFGVSIVPNRVRANSRKVAKIARVALLTGTKSTAKDGTIRVNLSVVFEGQETTSSGTLDLKSGILKASSLTKLGTNDVAYKWSAVQKN